MAGTLRQYHRISSCKIDVCPDLTTHRQRRLAVLAGATFGMVNMPKSWNSQRVLLLHLQLHSILVIVVVVVVVVVVVMVVVVATVEANK